MFEFIKEILEKACDLLRDSFPYGSDYVSEDTRENLGDSWIVLDCESMVDKLTDSIINCSHSVSNSKRQGSNNKQSINVNCYYFGEMVLYHY